MLDVFPGWSTMWLQKVLCVLPLEHMSLYYGGKPACGLRVSHTLQTQARTTKSVQRSSNPHSTLLFTCSRPWPPQHLSAPQIPRAQDRLRTMRALLQASLNISPPIHGTGPVPAGQPGITANGHNSAIYALVGVMLVVALITAIFASMACLKSRQDPPAEAQKVGRCSAL